jgi:hypothetical protein
MWRNSWRREDNRGVSNGDQVSRVAALAMNRGKRVDFTAIGSGTFRPLMLEPSPMWCAWFIHLPLSINHQG